MTRLAVFDCDGTLVDGQAAICASMEEAFAAAKLSPPCRGDIRRIVGLSLPLALRHLAPDASEEQRAIAVEQYKTSFSGRRLSGLLEEPLFDGIASLIEGLALEGWLLGVATGKSDRGLNACLQNHGIREHFVTLQTADRHPSKPDPAMLIAALVEAEVDRRDAVMIGDTSFDMEMARDAGVRAIGVSWGYHDPQELFEAGASAVADDAQQLREMICGPA